MVKIRVQFHSFTSENPVFPTLVIEEIFFSPFLYPGAFVGYSQDYFFLCSLFCFIGLYPCFMPIAYCFFFFMTITLWYNLKWGNVMPLPALFFLLKIALAVQCLWQLHMHFRVVVSTSMKDAIEILIGIALNLKVALGNKDILTFILIHERGVCIHLFVSSLFSFINVSQFSVYQIFNLQFVKLTNLNLFVSILFYEAFVNEIIFLISFFG